MSRDFDWPEFLFLLGALRWTDRAVADCASSAAASAASCSPSRARRRTRSCAGSRATYIGVMQGTPVLMQLFLAYYGLAVLTGIRIDPWPAVTLAFTMYAAAFLGRDLARRDPGDPAAAVGGGAGASARAGRRSCVT